MVRLDNFDEEAYEEMVMSMEVVGEEDKYQDCLGTKSAKGMVGVDSFFEPEEGEITKKNIDEGKDVCQETLTGNKVARGEKDGIIKEEGTEYRGMKTNYEAFCEEDQGEKVPDGDIKEVDAKFVGVSAEGD